MTEQRAQLHAHYSGSTIRGRVWQLQDKACGAGVLRTELFIHTEETPDNDQICSPDPDDPWCWDDTAAGGGVAGTNDYYSLACIKVRRHSPEGNWANNLVETHTAWHDQTNISHNVSRDDTVYVASP